jgi:hypothetical protein
MSSEPERMGSRLFDVCIGVLLAAMALWGAVTILQAIWVWLCVGALVVGLGALVWRWIASRYRGW